MSKQSPCIRAQRARSALLPKMRSPWCFQCAGWGPAKSASPVRESDYCPLSPTSPSSLRGGPARAPQQSTHLPPVLVASLGPLGHDAGPEPQVPTGVQCPQSLLVPEGYADRLQSLPFTENRGRQGVGTSSRGPTHQVQGRKPEL